MAAVVSEPLYCPVRRHYCKCHDWGDRCDVFDDEQLPTWETPVTQTRAKHIPGPWTVDEHTIFGPKGEEIAALADEDGPLHKVKGEVRTFQRPKSIELMEANTRLIAAAPDLLYACQEAAELIRNGGTVPIEGETWKVLMRAIEKAT